MVFPGTFAATDPTKPALVQADDGRVVTYGALEQRSVRLANHLREQGLAPGDSIAFIAENTPEVFEVYWAALRSGLYVTGVNHHLTPDEAAYILTDCGARALVGTGEHADLVTAVAELVPGLEVRLAFEGPVRGFDDYEEALAAASPVAPADQPRGTDMLYSSGTTGRPKGVKAPLPPRQVDEPGDMLAAVFGPLYGFDADTVYYSAAPTYHAAPLRFGGMVSMFGGTLVMSRRFDAETSLGMIEQHRVTHSQWVPTMFVRMLKLDDEVREQYDVSSLRVAIHAAAPCPVEVKQRMIDWWGPILHEYYSSTEANGITLIGPEDWLAHPGSVGRAALGVIRVCGPDGTELATGETGTVYFERDELPFTYHRDPERTAAVTHPAHPTWTTTGDIGHVDDEGFLYLTDRTAFTIISGGVNVYPQEIENALALHPAILDVAVVGVPDDDLGQAVKAFVQPVADATPSETLAAEILTSLEGTLARYKIPRTVEFVDALPRTATGKLAKGRLVEAQRRG